MVPPEETQQKIMSITLSKEVARGLVSEIGGISAFLASVDLPKVSPIHGSADIPMCRKVAEIISQEIAKSDSSSNKE